MPKQEIALMDNVKIYKVKTIEVSVTPILKKIVIS